VAAYEPAIGTRSWWAIASITLLGTAASVAFSLVLNHLLFLGEELAPFGRSMLATTLPAVAIATPLSFLLAYYLQEARRYRRELTRSVSYDQLTEFFNGSAFSSLVDRRVSSRSTEGPRQGGFLLVSTENLRSINMHYGLGWGEQALLLVASTIRSCVRSDDVVGRLGPSEFGIFLPGATEENTREVGQRIRAGVAAVYFAPVRFAPAGGTDLLSVSVSGVIFENEFGFEGMYRAAEQQLASAESSGDIKIVRIASDLSGAPNGQSHH
jgi:diguanylate cyclase (GGDEF)-like protein